MRESWWGCLEVGDASLTQDLVEQRTADISPVRIGDAYFERSPDHGLMPPSGNRYGKTELEEFPQQFPAGDGTMRNGSYSRFAMVTPTRPRVVFV